MIEDIGQIPFDAFDDANVPVDIWLTEIDEDKESFAEGYRYELKAGCYMPRRGRVEETALNIIASTREELAEIVKKHLLPLYETAVVKINKIISGEEEDLYYWGL